MKKSGTAVSSLLILSVCVFLCAFAFPSANIAADISTNHVYTYITAEKLLREYSNDPGGARGRYNGQYMLVSGRYENFSSNNFNIMDSSYGSLVCENARGVSFDFSPYEFNVSMIAVYGRCSFGAFGDSVRLTDVVKVVPLPVVTSDNIWFTEDGASFDLDTAENRIVKYVYSVPPSWKSIETNIKEGGLGSIDGYRYELNRLPGGSDDPEMLFVCWFGEDKLVNRAHITTRQRDVEKAVIDNISGNSSTFSRYIRTSDRGTTYHYFIGKYTSPLDMKGYHAEYIFCPYDDGMVMYLYIYRETRHMSDVMFLIRSMTG
ncbi:MAG: hypothetical protein ILP19_03460 [Oscillospiraceae bacterium]|nr:hypothetical protein [Oscillospiraceae bacterium]